MKRITAFLAYTLFSIGLGGALMAQDSAGKYTIGPGDALQIEILEDPTFNRSVLVGPDGRVTVPLAGTFDVLGKTLEGVTTTLSERLARNFALEPTVIISLQSVGGEDGGGRLGEQPIFLYVLGESAQKGRIPLFEGSTLLQALASIGGFSRFAATNRIQLRRVNEEGAETIFTFSYDDIVSGVSDAGQITVEDNDIILVPERGLFEM